MPAYSVDIDYDLASKHNTIVNADDQDQAEFFALNQLRDEEPDAKNAVVTGVLQV
jgi:hypothetical protein